ncbi:8202_t:CDS:1, partial [Gigaspora margarita]
IENKTRREKQSVDNLGIGNLAIFILITGASDQIWQNIYELVVQLRIFSK